MNFINSIINTLKKLGISLEPKTLKLLLILGVVAGLCAAAWLVLYPLWKKRKEEAAKPALAVGGTPEEAKLPTNQLRDAWKRFERQLPGVYRRSLLNFEHFVVLGASASGKSKLVDLYSDWRRQAKQLPGSQANDPNLPIYLASGSVLTELPARYLTDHSQQCHAALRKLWTPLYSGRTPTVIVAVDCRWLKENSPEILVELAEATRAKINLLSSIRGTPIDVRVVLTFLDSIEGYSDFAGFCREQSLPARIPILLGGDELPPLSSRITAWFESLRDQFPRALTRMASVDFLRLVTFVRKAPELAPPLSRYLDALFAHEATSKRPTCGGVFLAMDPAGVASPTERVLDRSPGPDPRRWHLLATSVVAAACMAFLYTSYRNQRELYTPAQRALSSYDAGATGTDAERTARSSIREFAYKNHGWFDTHPDYFGEARKGLRQDFSKRVREEVLIPQLKRIAQEGTTKESNLALPTRRSLYYLALIHSDQEDRIGILEPGRLEVWSRMTGLSQDLIRDYLKSTEEAWKIPVSFDLNNSDGDLPANWQVWTQFLRDIDDAIHGGTIKPEVLQDLQTRAGRLALSLERYENDDLTAALLDQLDAAAGTSTGQGQGAPPLRLAYRTRYMDYLAGAGSYKILENRERLKTILRVVRAGAVDAQAPYLLRSLIDRLEALYDRGGMQVDEEPVKVTMAQQDYTFDPKRWRMLLRDSTGKELIQQFVRAAATAPSIFFGPEQDAELRPIFWNPTNDGSSIFVGKGTLEARYTRAAYDNHIRAVILKLSEVMDKAKVPEDQRRGLRDFLLERVRRYSAEYRTQLLAFVQSYGLRAASPEMLRVALVQMSKEDASAFNDYLKIVDQNSRLDSTHELLRPMETAAFDFTAWHNIVGGDSGAPEINKYRAILSQLLVDLGPEAGPAVDPQGPRSLETDLSAPGRLVLTEVKGEKGSYAQLAAEWLTSVRLPEYQRPPFTAPFQELTRLGRRDIEGVLSRVWQEEMLPGVRQISTHFPFDPSSIEDVTPTELTGIFHPQTGRYFDIFRRYFEPISEFSNGPFRPKPSLRGRVSTPKFLYDLTNGAASLAARLWDQDGKPIPIPVRIATVPFEHGRDPRTALTLVYINVGAGSLFNFNQMPAQVTMQFDWTKETSSQVGLQLTNLDTKENLFVEPTRAESSFWSLLRLQSKGQSEAARYPTGAHLYSWPFKIPRGDNETMQAQFVVVDDLWTLFSMGTFVRTKLNASPVTASR